MSGGGSGGGERRRRQRRRRMRRRGRRKDWAYFIQKENVFAKTRPYGDPECTCQGHFILIKRKLLDSILIIHKPLFCYEVGGSRFI
jgi:GT2 family glycosyltransferase